ncbi:hypothetical protein D3C78_1459790 [compost metagenome]
MLAGGDRPQNQRARGLDAAHDLDDDVGLGVVDDLVGAEGEVGGVEAAVLADVAHGDAAQLERPADAVLVVGLVGEDQLGDAQPDRAAAEQADADGGCGHIVGSRVGLGHA